MNLDLARKVAMAVIAAMALLILAGGLLQATPPYMFYRETCGPEQLMVMPQQALAHVQGHRETSWWLASEGRHIPGTEIAFRPVYMTEGRDAPLVTPLHWETTIVGEWRGHHLEIPRKFTRCGDDYDLGGTDFFD